MACWGIKTSCFSSIVSVYGPYKINCCTAAAAIWVNMILVMVMLWTIYTLLWPRNWNMFWFPRPEIVLLPPANWPFMKEIFYLNNLLCKSGCIAVHMQLTMKAMKAKRFSMEDIYTSSFLYSEVSVMTLIRISVFFCTTELSP